MLYTRELLSTYNWSQWNLFTIALKYNTITVHFTWPPLSIKCPPSLKIDMLLPNYWFLNWVALRCLANTLWRNRLLIGHLLLIIFHHICTHRHRCWGSGGDAPRNNFEGADYLSPPPQIPVSKVWLYLEKMSLNYTVLPIETWCKSLSTDQQSGWICSIQGMSCRRIHRYNEAFVYKLYLIDHLTIFWTIIKCF